MKFLIIFLIIHCLFTFLVIIFGSLTLCNMRNYVAFVRRRSGGDQSMLRAFQRLSCNGRLERRRIETQLNKMIITEALVTIITSLPYAGYVIFRLVTSRKERTAIQMIYENFIELIVRTTIYIQPSCGFYVYLFSLRVLQKRFFNIIRSRLRRCL